MAEKEKSKSKEKSKKNLKRLDISALAVCDNIIFNKTDQWAYYRLSNSVYDFLSSNAKITVAKQLINAFVNLMGDRQESLECHIIVSTSPVDLDAWETQVLKISKEWETGPSFEEYILEMLEHLRSEEYLKKVTYLGINIGKRGALDLDSTNMFEAGLSEAFATVKNWMSTALQTHSEEVSPSEEREARRKEEGFYQTLSTGNLHAERCTAEELLLLIKRQFYPAMSAPYLDIDHENRLGPGDLELELGSAIENKLRWLRINQMVGDDEGDGYRATLTISGLPRRTNFPYDTFPFMYFLHKRALPFTSYARFTLHPTVKMKKELEKKKKEQKDEMENLAAGGSVDSDLGVMPTDVTEALEDMSTLNEMLSSGNMPWVEGTYRIAIETPDLALLKKYCSIVKQRFTDLGVIVHWTSGDQASLFLEQMPGDKLRSNSHKQITNLTMFGTSGFNFSSDVGDRIFEVDPEADKR